MGFSRGLPTMLKPHGIGSNLKSAIIAINNLTRGGGYSRKILDRGVPPRFINPDPILG